MDMYAIYDADTFERYSTTDYACYESALRERNRLVLQHARTGSLIVVRITPDGEVHLSMG